MLVASVLNFCTLVGLRRNLNGQRVEVELLEEPALLSALSSELRNFGDLLTCDRCKDSRELIGAILVVPAAGAS